MRTLRFTNAAQRPVLIEDDVPLPKPRSGEVLVRVHAAGITPTELAWYPTTHTKDGRPRTGAVPCHEFAGEIAGFGEGLAGLSIGQQIYGMNDWFADGALAEYCVTRADCIEPKPQKLSFAEAASVPIGALSAWQGLFDRAKLQAGEHVLVQGGAGAVGVFAIQLAHRHGAHVTATVSERNAGFVKQLGADETIDYRAVPFESVVRGLDVIFDTVGGDTLKRSRSVLAQSGRLVTIASDSATDAAFLLVEPNRVQLIEIGRLLDGGELRPVVDTVVPFSRAADAYTGGIERKGRGKQVVMLPGS